MDLPWSLPLVLVLLGVGFVLVTAATRTLAAAYANACRRHMLIVDARQMRIDWERRVEERRGELLDEIGFEQDEDGMIVVGTEDELKEKRQGLRLAA